MNLWEKIRRDLEKELKASYAFIKEGTAVLRKKSKEISKEEEQRYKIIELKTRIQEEMSGLGGRVYELGLKDKNPLQDKKVAAFYNRINKLEMQISKLEGKPKPPAKKAAKKRTTKK
ncbi:MAG: hypothetical protein AB1552_04050 [Nitrospirota bacterium]